MQETLTFANCKNYNMVIKKQKKIKNLLFLSLIVLIIFLITIIMSNLNSNNNYYNAKNYYFLSLNETGNGSCLTFLQEKVGEVVGESYIHYYNNRYYVVEFMYQDNLDALSNLNKFKSIFANAKIIYVCAEQIKKSTRELINNDVELKYLFYKLNIVNEKVLCLLKNNKNKQDILKEINVYINEINTHLKIIKNKEKSNLSESLEDSALAVQEKINEYKNKILMGKDHIENLKILYMNLIIVEINLRKALNCL